MIRAKTSDGRFILGIDNVNVRRLKAGQPIVVDLAQLGGNDIVMIMYGATLEDVVAELELATGHKLPSAQPLPSGGGKPQ